MKVLTPIKAIQTYCIECSGGMTKAIKLCPVEKCPLYPYRMGKRSTADTDIDSNNKNSEKSDSYLPLFS